MKPEDLYKTHEFLKKHELVPVKLKTKRIWGSAVEQCKHCKMLFLHKRPITDTPIESLISERDQLEPLLPDFSLVTYRSSGFYGDIWWALKSGDKQEEVLTGLLIGDPSSYTTHTKMLSYAYAVGHKQPLYERIRDTCNYPGRLLEYNIAVKIPIPEIRTQMLDQYNARHYYHKVDKPYIEPIIADLEAKKAELWEQMKPAWKNTKLYKSDWYKDLEAKHKQVVDKVKALHAEKMKLKQDAYAKR